MASSTLLTGFGSAGLVLQPGEKTILRRTGIAEKTSIFKSTSDPGFPFIPLVTPYPNQSTGGFVCDSCQVEQVAGPFWVTTVVWISLFVPASSYVTYETKMIQIPVDQSSGFSDIAGTPSSPLNGAVFESTGVF